MRASLRCYVSLLLLVAACFPAACASEGGDEDVSSDKRDEAGVVRRAAVAGTFYPGSPAALAGDVDAYLEAAGKPGRGRVVAVLAPHAGYVYSGAVAAHAYAWLDGAGFDTAVVVAPSHRYPFRGASVYSGDGYETPLGVVPVDGELAAAMRDESSGIGFDPRAHAAEHSLEVQVPFLQRTLGEFRIVPIVMGSQDEAAVRALASRIVLAVSQRGRESVVLVASTDLSHYHDYETAVELDSRVVSFVEAFDPEGLLEALASGRCEACGGGPAAAVMMAARELGAKRAVVTKYANSGDVTGDREQVVGYMSAVLLADANPTGGAGVGGDGAQRAPEERPDPDADARGPAPYEGLNAEERDELLRLARASIAAALSGDAPPASTLRSRSLDTECGAFVTLNKGGRLRGCIGYIQAVKPLRETVSEMAVQAAMHDPRFPSVSAGELDDIDIEISVLSPLVEVKDVEEIQVGRDGLLVRLGAASGLLLPQVATDYGWDRGTFLEQTCRKAGLPADSWKRDDILILKFTAEVFGEPPH